MLYVGKNDVRTDGVLVFPQVCLAELYDSLIAINEQRRTMQMHVITEVSAESSFKVIFSEPRAEEAVYQRSVITT
ncbi:hypothetical protein WS7_06205 [Xanthomonas citri pv. malvacearum str. GSPB2388]|nr:hypothetical protein WS7_06205 [Xanthomonas citri pv. malvacearum str. GSPB2388]